MKSILNYCRLALLIAGAAFLIIAGLTPEEDVNAQVPEDVEGYTLLYSHRGFNNPLLEDWQSTEVYPGEGINIGPVKDKSTFAWQIDDNSPHKRFAYFRYLSDTEAQRAAQNGWLLETRLRIVDHPDPVPGDGATAGVGDAPSIEAVAEDASPFVLFRSGTRSFQLHFATTAEAKLGIFIMRDLSVGRRTGLLIPLSAGIDDYLYLKLEYSPDTKRVAISIDDAIVYNGYTGARFESQPVIMWGAGSSTATGHANFNYLGFRVGQPDFGE